MPPRRRTEGEQLGNMGACANRHAARTGRHAFTSVACGYPQTTAANFRTLIALKSLTSPPTRLVA